jgi:hypothetical protein
VSGFPAVDHHLGAGDKFGGKTNPRFFPDSPALGMTVELTAADYEQR